MVFNPRHFSSKTRWLLLAALLLLFPALLINLGLMAFYDDEGIRALVALEMKLSGNWVTPTMFGEFYYNKPPLYNWILLLVFNATGHAGEFIARLPTVLFLLAYAVTVYFFYKRTTVENPQSPIPNPSPLLTSLSLITCGRILFWDSMLALIDTCFSWVMFLLFMVIYREGERERYGRLFIFSYLLAAAGFLLKGLPAVVFLGIALLTYFIWQKKLRQLLSWAHAGGMAVFALVVGGYYTAYATQNGLEQVFSTLFNESAKRTFVEHSLGETVLHFFTFPFEMGYHFLPWTLPVIYFFRKNALRLIRENKFITWNVLVFLTTILPYWASPEVYPRYLLMHVPLAFSVFFYLHFRNKEENARMSGAVEIVFFALCLLAAVASLAPVFYPPLRDVSLWQLKVAALFVALALLSWLYRRWKQQRMLIVVLVMLVLRIGFDWFVLPSRYLVMCSTKVRETTIEAAQKLEGRPVYVLEHSLGFQPVTGFYFSRETGRILRVHHENFDKNAFYILNPYTYPSSAYEEVSRFWINWQCQERVLGKLK